MDRQIPYYYLDDAISPQEYDIFFQPPPVSIPESSFPPNHSRISHAYAGTQSPQSQLHPYQIPHQRTSRIRSEPTYPSQLPYNQDYIPQNTYLAPPAHQHRRTLSVGADPRCLAGSTSMEFLSTVTDYSRNMMQPLGPLFSSTESMLTQPPESPVGPGWPAQVPTPGEYLLPPSQEQPPFGDSRRQAILPAEPEQTSYGPVGDRKVVQNLEGNPPYGLGQQFHSLPETYGALNSEGLSPQDQTTYPEKTAYMRPAPTHPYTNTPASWSIPREQAQRFIQPPLVEPSKPILAPTQYQPPHPEIRTPVYSQPRAGYSQATGPMNAHYGQPGNTPVQPANGYAIQSDNPATIIYVDVGVQTDPELFQPAIRPIGKTSGRAETTTGGQKFKFVQSTATGQSSGSTSASKRAPRSQKKLPPTQPALRLQTPSEPGPSLPEPHIDPTSVGSLGTSLEDRYTPRTLGPDHPPVIQGGTSNRSLSGSVPVLRGPPSAPSGSTCEASTLRAPEDTLPTPSAAPTRPVQQLHALPSPCISDAGVDQVLHGSAAPCDPIPLTRRVSPGISLQNCKASSSLHVPSLTSGGANCLPTPDPSPGVNGMDQRLVFPFEPLRHEQPEATTLQVSVSQTHQANDSHLAESSTAHQAGVQTQGPANTPLVVPPIHIFSPEDTISSPGRASNQGYAHAENNPDEAPQPRSQQGPKSGLTHRRANQFTQPSAQKRGNSIDHQLAAQSQRQPQGIHNVENHTGGKPRSTSAISQCDTNKLRQNQPGLVRRDGQRQAQACSPKRERSANETGPEQQTKRRREDKERQSSRDAGEGAPERSVPQAARTDNESFDVNMWLNSRLSQVISEAEEHPVADTEDTSSQNQQQQGRMQAQSWGLGPKKPYAIGGSSMKHAPLPHTMPPPSSADNSSARVAILGAPTYPMTSRTPGSNNTASAHTVPTAIQPRAHWGTDSEVQSEAVDLDTLLGSSVQLDNIIVSAKGSQRPTLQVGDKTIDSPSALRPDCGSAILEIGKGMEHTAVDYTGGQGQEVSIPATAAQHGVTRPHNPSSVSNPQNSADLQTLNAFLGGEPEFNEPFDYDSADTYGMLFNGGYL